MHLCKVGNKTSWYTDTVSMQHHQQLVMLFNKNLFQQINIIVVKGVSNSMIAFGKWSRSHAPSGMLHAQASTIVVL